MHFFDVAVKKTKILHLKDHKVQLKHRHVLACSSIRKLVNKQALIPEQYGEKLYPAIMLRKVRRIKFTISENENGKVQQVNHG